MSMGQTMMFEQFHAGRRMICGVCAWAGMRSGLPIWAVRVLAVLLLLSHLPLAMLVYFGTAIWLKLQSSNGAQYRFGPGLPGAGWQAPRWPGPAPSSGNPAASSWDHAAMMDRFSRLDRRLAQMEAEAMDGEFQLRRGFRDLER